MYDFEDVRELDSASVLPIVVGSNLEAEVWDRPIAQSLRTMIIDQLEGGDAPQPVVLTDLWYLNQAPLRLRPTIAVGRPDVNAATAFLAGKLPTAFILEERFRVQLDPELLDPHVCLWGTNPEETRNAVEMFGERYLAAWVEEVAALV